MKKRKFINFNKVYNVDNSDLGINAYGSHYVIIVWFNKIKQICRVKTITSLEHQSKDKNGNLVFLNRNGKKYPKFEYDYKALNEAKRGIITPYSIKQLGTSHWSGIHNKSVVISFNKLNTLQEVEYAGKEFAIQVLKLKQVYERK